MKKLFFLGMMFFCFSSGWSAIDKDAFLKAVSAIHQESYEKVSFEEMYEWALEGVLKGLDKKIYPEKANERNFNTIISERSYNELKNEMDGEVTGIGIVIKSGHEDSFYPYIEKVLEGGSAEKSGLKNKDLILSIDGGSSREMSFEDLIYKIRGKVGSKVKLTILRDNKVIEKSVVREKIHFSPIEEIKTDKNFSYIKIRSFNKDSAKELQNIILNNKKMKVVIDLRDSMGGPFDSMVESLELFFNKGQEMFLVLKQKGEIKEKIVSKIDGPLKEYSLILLINKDTMSASEAFASSLRENGKGVIIGEKSYGKGTIEKIISIDKKSHMKFSVGQMANINGISWINNGVEPDFQFKLESLNLDQIEKIVSKL